MATDERPPPMHLRALLSLREAFFPAAFRETLRSEWERFKDIAREEQAREEIENPSYRACREQRRICRDYDPNTESLTSFLRRYWEAGKPRKPWPPAPPTNE